MFLCYFRAKLQIDKATTHRLGYTDRMRSITEDDMGSMLANPYYAVTLQDYLFGHQKRASADEDWVLLNIKLMEDLGAKQWLEELLDVLSLDNEIYDGHDIINPSLAVHISERLRGRHEPLITREQWIQANVKQIKEVGSSNWLWRLLNALETGGPEAE